MSTHMQFTYLKYDLFRYFYPDNDVPDLTIWKIIKIIILNQGIWAIALYRFRRWTQTECHSSVVRAALKPIGNILQLLVEITTGIQIAPEVDIGPGFYIGHFGNIFIGGTTKIGKFVNVSQEVTIGYAGKGELWGQPDFIGDFVYIAPGAKVVGKVTIGNNVVIGTNSVVTKSIPENAVVFGVPARILNYDSSKGFIRYNYERNKDIL